MTKPKKLPQNDFEHLRDVSGLKFFDGTIDSIVCRDGEHVKSLRIRIESNSLSGASSYLVKAYAGPNYPDDINHLHISRHLAEIGDRIRVLGKELQDEHIPLIQAHFLYNATAGVGLAYNPKTLELIAEQATH